MPVAKAQRQDSIIGWLLEQTGNLQIEPPSIRGVLLLAGIFAISQSLLYREYVPYKLISPHHLIPYKFYCCRTAAHSNSCLRP